MDCSEYRDQIVPLIKGRLAPEEAARLRQHLEVCLDCKREYEESNWLIAGMMDAREALHGEHVSSTLLYQFVEAPNTLEPETVEFVGTHLAGCQRCREDAAVIRELMGARVTGDSSPVKTPRQTSSAWGRFFRRRLLPAAAAVSAIAVILIVAIVSVDRTSYPSVAEVVTAEDAKLSGHTIVALTNDMTTRGGDSPSADAPTVLSADDDRALVLNLDAATFDDEEMAYSVVIKDPDGKTKWQSELTIDQLQTGSVWVVVDRKDFEPGVHRISVIERQGDYRVTVSTARFEIEE